MAFDRCGKQYFNNHISTIPLVDVVSAKEIQPGVYELFFPYPFVLIGFADNPTNWSTVPPVSETPMPLYPGAPNSGLSNQYSDLLAKFYSVFMYANRDVGNYATSPFLGACIYSEYLFCKFKNYFASHLNFKLKEIFYNQFLYPQQLVTSFWANEVTLPDADATQLRMYELVQTLFKTTDRRLWGAPGKYVFNTNSAESTIELNATDCPIE